MTEDEPSNTRRIRVFIRLHKVKVVGDCEEVKTVPGKLPALDTPELKCRARCYEKAYADVLNCSYYGFRLPAYNVDTLDFCYGPELTEDTQAAVDAVFKECFNKERCYERKACEGYYYEFGLISDNYHGEGNDLKNTVKTSLVLEFDAVPLVMETEKWAMSSFVLFATVGGLFGIFIGTSILDIVNFATAIILKLTKKKGSADALKN